MFKVNGSRHPNYAVLSRLEPFVRDIGRLARRYPILSTVLTGSAARGEEQWDGDGLLSDLDVIVVVPHESLRLGARVQEVVDRHRDLGVEGGAVAVRALRRYLSVAYFEAYAAGYVLDGDSAALACISLQRSHDIPPWEGTRLLLNRMFEHFKVRLGYMQEERCVLKTYEAIGESYMIAGRMYRASFGQRADLLPRILPAGALRDRCMWATRCRSHGEWSAVGAPSIGEACDDLLGAIDLFTPRATGHSSLESRVQEYWRGRAHRAQRAYWAARLASRMRDPRPALRCDPIIGIWQAGLTALASGDARRGYLSELVADWSACPQVYEEAVW